MSGTTITRGEEHARQQVADLIAAKKLPEPEHVNWTPTRGDTPPRLQPGFLGISLRTEADLAQWATALGLSTTDLETIRARDWSATGWAVLSQSLDHALAGVDYYVSVRYMAEAPAPVMKCGCVHGPDCTGVGL